MRFKKSVSPGESGERKKVDSGSTRRESSLRVVSVQRGLSQ